MLFNIETISGEIMSNIRIAFVPVARTNFHMETAEKYFADSVKFMGELSSSVVCPKKLLSEPSEVAEFLKEEQKNGAFDLVVFQNSTFVDNTFALEIIQHTSAPVVLWCVREPKPDGGRLKLNSMTGVYSAANAFCANNRTFELLYGTPFEEHLKEELLVHFKAAGLVNALKNLKLGMIGVIPPGFTIADVDIVSLKRDIGVSIVASELHQLINEARAITDDEAKQSLENIKKHIVSLDMNEEEAIKFGKFNAALEKYAAREKVGAIAARCWPDVFVELGIAPCLAYSVMAEKLPVACEVDAHGAVTMFMLSHLAESPAFLGDPVHLDEENGTLAFWHCGHGAPSLADEPKMGVHPNRRLAPVMQYTAKSGRVTVARLGVHPQFKEYRLLVANGDAISMPQLFEGTSVAVRMDIGSDNFVKETCESGWEYHFAVVYGDVSAEMVRTGIMLGIEVEEM